MLNKYWLLLVILSILDSACLIEHISRLEIYQILFYDDIFLLMEQFPSHLHPALLRHRPSLPPSFPGSTITSELLKSTLLRILVGPWSS